MMIQTILIVLIAFFAGIGWKELWGPEKVVVLRDESLQIKDSIINIYKLEGDSATLDALRNYNSKLSIDSREVPSKGLSQITRPKIKFPSIVDGYALVGINSYANVDIFRNTYTQNEFIEVELTFFDKTTLKKITPIFIDVVREEGDRNIVMIWSEQFTAVHQKNLIKFSSDFPMGEYVLTIGFYFMDEVNQKFPPKYLRSFNIKIL